MSEARIWYSRNSEQETLPSEFQNEIVLSPEFFKEIQQQLPIHRIVLAPGRIESLTKLPSSLRVNRIDLDTLVLEKHPDHGPVFLLDSYSYAAILSRLINRHIQASTASGVCSSPPSLPLPGVGPLQHPNMLLLPQSNSPRVRLMGEVAPFSQTIMQPAHMENMVNLEMRYAYSYRGVTHLGIPIDVQEAAISTAHFAVEDQPHHTSADWNVARVVPRMMSSSFPLQTLFLRPFSNCAAELIPAYGPLAL